MKWMIIAVASLVVATGVRPNPNTMDLEFQEWKLKFRVNQPMSQFFEAASSVEKSYTSNNEETVRKNVWMNTRNRVLDHNMLADKGKSTFRMGMNYFSDMSEAEYRQALLRHLDLSKIIKKSTQRFNQKWRQSRKKLPNYKDWREKDCVTPVKDQGSCASCWAFSAVGALESQTCIKKGYLPSLSEQQLIDCSGQGCEGGHVPEAFKYSMNIEGNIKALYYMYKAENSKCRYNENIPKNIIGARCRKYEKLPHGDEHRLQKIIADIGPVSVSVDSSKVSFKDYASGVYYEPLCGNMISNITHAMLVVGYGTTDQGVDYWIVKNSFGTTWGEQGYIKMARNKDNNCAIASYAFYPVV